MSNHHEQKHEGYWTNAKLCRLVQNYPCFYDRGHPQYLKKDVVDKSWAIIAKEVKDSVASCKERWRNIRTAFARSINIYRTPSGPNRTKRYYLHDELQFLAKHITPGVPIRSSGHHDNEDTENSKNSIPEEEWTTTDEQDTYPEDDIPTINDGGDAADDDSLEINHASPMRKRRRTYEILDCKPEIMRVTPETQTSTDYDTMFLNGLLPEMKAMNFRQKIVFKKRIYQVLEELFDGNVDSSSTSATTSSSIPYSNQNRYQQTSAGAPKPSTVPNSQPIPMRTITIQGPRNPAVKTVITSSELNLLRNLSGILNNNQQPLQRHNISTAHVANSNATVETSVTTTSNDTNNVAVNTTNTLRDTTSSTSSPPLSVNSVVPTPMTSNIDPNLKVKQEPDNAV